MKLGYVGLGTMGGALAERLMQSAQLGVFDLDEGARAHFGSRGATIAEDGAALARKSDIVFLCLPRSQNVRSAIFGAGGLIEGLSPGKLIIDQTSGDPSQTRRMAGELEERGIALLDAPVSGGARGAATGTISMMVGGAEEDYRRAVPALEMIGPNHVHCGPVGSGQVLKLINNTISTCNRLAMLEGVALGVKNGLSLDIMADVLNAGGARSRATERMLPALARGETASTFALSLMLKDLNLAGTLAQDSGAPLTFGQLARAMLQVTLNDVGEDAGIDDIAGTVAVQAGITFPD